MSTLGSLLEVKMEPKSDKNKLLFFGTLLDHLLDRCWHKLCHYLCYFLLNSEESCQKCELVIFNNSPHENHVLWCQRWQNWLKNVSKTRLKLYSLLGYVFAHFLSTFWVKKLSKWAQTWRQKHIKKTTSKKETFRDRTMCNVVHTY